MKIIFIKRTLLIMLCIIAVFSSCIVANKNSFPVSATYFSNARKVPIYSVKTSENRVAISFDAAWGADKTCEIINVCNEYNVTATFFLVDFWVKKYPEMVKQIANNGFEIGLHSSTHPDMTQLSVSQITEELTNNIESIERITNIRPKVFRPPYGYYNNNLINVCESLNLSCIEWSVDSLDWKGLSASAMAGRVISKAEKGSIILFHNNSDNIISGLKMVLETFKNKNLQAVSVGELIYYDNFKIDVNGMQIKL